MLKDENQYKVYMQALISLQEDMLSSITKISFLHVLNNCKIYSETPQYVNKKLQLVLKKIASNFENPPKFLNCFDWFKEIQLDWTSEKEGMYKKLIEQNVTLEALQKIKEDIIELDILTNNDLSKWDIECAISKIIIKQGFSNVLKITSEHLESLVREEIDNMSVLAMEVENRNQEIQNIIDILLANKFYQNFKVIYQQNIHIMLAILGKKFETLESQTFITAFIKSISTLAEFDHSKILFDICEMQKINISMLIINAMMQNNPEIDQEEKQKCLQLGFCLLEGKVIPQNLMSISNRLFLNGYFMAMPEKMKRVNEDRDDDESKRRRFFQPFGPMPPPPPPKRCFVCKYLFPPNTFYNHIKFCKPQ